MNNFNTGQLSNCLNWIFPGINKSNLVIQVVTAILKLVFSCSLKITSIELQPKLTLSQIFSIGHSQPKINHQTVINIDCFNSLLIIVINQTMIITKLVTV